MVFVGNIIHDLARFAVVARIVENEWANNGDGFTRRQQGSQFLQPVMAQESSAGFRGGFFSTMTSKS